MLWAGAENPGAAAQQRSAAGTPEPSAASRATAVSSPPGRRRPSQHFVVDVPLLG